MACSYSQIRALSQNTTIVIKSSINSQPEHQLKSAVLSDNNSQQTMLAITFGVIATLLALATIVIAYLQLRRHAEHPPDLEINQPEANIELPTAPPTSDHPRPSRTW
ncbi:hypothetical protein BST61_g7595 [Cercospora zeina]